MSTIDRRGLLTDFLPGAAVAAAGLVSVDIISSTKAAVASPLAPTIFVKPDDMTENIQVATREVRIIDVGGLVVGRRPSAASSAGIIAGENAAATAERCAMSCHLMLTANGTRAIPAN